MLLAACGAVTAVRWLASRSRALAGIAVAALLTAATIAHVDFLRTFFGEYNQRFDVYHGFQTDLLEACRWLKPHFQDADALVCTGTGMNQPFAITLVGLDYDPARWFRDAHDVRQLDGWDHHLRYGKVYFLDRDRGRATLDSLATGGHDRRIYFIVRPGELGLGNPVYVVHRPDGSDALWICERRL